MDDSSQKPAADLLDSDGEGSIDFREYWIVLLEKAWLIVLCTLAGLLAGLSYARNLPVSYHAQAVLQLGADHQSPLGGDPGYGAPAGGQEMFQTVIASLSSHGFLKRVVETNKLDEDPRFLPPKPDGQPYSVEEAGYHFGSMMTAEMRPGTRLIDLNVEHSDPQMAQKLADSLATEYMSQGLEAKAANSQIAVKFLEAEAEKQRNKLEQSEQKLQEYKEDNDAMSLDERQDTVITKLKAISSQLSEAKAARMRLEADYSDVKANADSPARLLAIGSVASRPSVIEARRQISEIEARIAQLALRYTEKHPRMIQERTLLADVKASLKEAVLSVPQLMNSDLERAIATEHSSRTP